MEMYDPDGIPPTIPAQRTITEAPAVTVTVQQARTERLEAIIAGMEGALRNIRSRAQKGMLETQAVRAVMQLEVIDTLAALALMGDTSNGANIERETLYDEP